MSNGTQLRKTDIAAVIEKRRDMAAARQETGELIRRLLIIAIVVLLLLSQVFLITQVEGQDMFPALKDGDHR